MKKISKKLIKITSISVSAALLTTATAAYAFTKAPVKNTSLKKDTVSAQESTAAGSDNTAGKDETVYVISGADGAAKKVIVSDWLKNSSGDKSITDISELQDVQNVKGNEGFTTGSGNSMVWDAQGNDVYYQGISQKELPVDISISYKLDGKDITPEELAGKSGKVTIQFNYTNNQKKTEEINGRQVQVCVPFVMLTGMILDNDNFKNVTIDNGKVINDGSRYIVMGYAVPGVKESLNLSHDDLNIPDSVCITADVTDFSLTTTVTLALNNVFDDLKLDKIADIDDLKASLDDLGEASGKLTDGSSDLYSGLSRLLSNSDKLTDGIGKLYDGSKSLNSGAVTLYNGATQLSAGEKELYDNLAALENGLISVKDGVTTLAGGYGQVIGGADQLANGLTSLDKGLSSLSSGIDQSYSALSQTIAANEQVLAGLKQIYAKNQSSDIAVMAGTLEKTIAAQKQLAGSMQKGNGGLKDGVIGLQAGTKKLEDGAAGLKDGIGQLNKGTGTLKNGILLAYNGSTKLKQGAYDLYEASGKLTKGAKLLAGGSDDLTDGIYNLKTKSSLLIDGVTKLANGSRDLKNGIKEFNDTGIEKLVDVFDGDVSDLVDRVNVMIDASRDYNNYSGISDGMSGNVKFIYKTDSIEAGTEK